MEEEAATCVVQRFMASTSSSIEYSNHSLLFSSYNATAADSNVMESSDVSLMGNLLTDLSSDFPYIGSNNGKYTVPDILQFPADQASKVTLLQMLEESDTSSPNSYTHLKLPVLEEPCDSLKLKQQEHHSQLLSCSSEAPGGRVAQQRAGGGKCVSGGMDSQGTSTGSLLKPCKSEPEIQVASAVLESSSKLTAPDAPNEFVAIDTFKGASAGILATSSANSDDISKNPGAAGTNSAGGCPAGASQSSSGAETPGTQHRPKRKRIKSCKNSEEVESQRQTHIAVERNRRKQMNEHLTVLRSLMPGSYVQRGDQASIIGGAIEFVKELEQLLQCLQAQKRRRMYSEAFSPKPSPSAVSSMPLPPFPPYASPAPSLETPTAADSSSSKFVNDNFFYDKQQIVAESKSEAADIEVKVIGSDAVVKVLTQRRPGQLLKTIAALEGMLMSIVHTNITTIEQTVLYSFTTRIGVESRLSVDEIAQCIQRVFSSSINASE